MTDIAWTRMNSGLRKNNAVTACFAPSICNTTLSTVDLAHVIETTRKCVAVVERRLCCHSHPDTRLGFFRRLDLYTEL